MQFYKRVNQAHQPIQHFNASPFYGQCVGNVGVLIYIVNTVKHYDFTVLASKLIVKSASSMTMYPPLAVTKSGIFSQFTGF